MIMSQSHRSHGTVPRHGVDTAECVVRSVIYPRTGTDSVPNNRDEMRVPKRDLKNSDQWSASSLRHTFRQIIFPKTDAGKCEAWTLDTRFRSFRSSSFNRSFTGQVGSL